MIFGRLDLFFRCLDLYFMFRTYILTVWTYILGFWTYILGFWTYTLGFELIFCVLNLYFGCLNLYFGYSGRVGSGRAGGRVGRVQHLGKNPFWESVSEKKWLLTILLNSELGVILQKRRAPKNAAFWCAACAEISHMRSIQARKLKLIIWVISQFNFWKDPLILYES